MKGFIQNIPIAFKAERPFPNKEILWGSEEGGQACFPTSVAAYQRKHSADPVPLQKFGRAASEAQERVWIVDEYLLIPDSGTSTKRIDQILSWLPLRFAASDFRLLTKQHQEVDENDLKKFKQRVWD
jgi:hypothetical protein